MTEENPLNAAREAVIGAALAHVPFDGWSETTLKAALADSGVEPALGAALFPRGALDLALAYHRQGDTRMMEALAATDLDVLRIRDRIASAVMTRLDLVEDKELVRRGSTFFALPQNAAEGARAIWGTADAIWTALGDTSDDVNWYSKRATLSAVYSATVLYWLGDDSPGHEATRDFLDRRIGDVMQFEKMKAAVRSNPLGKALLAGPMKLMEQIRAPRAPADLPGSLKDRT
ncbi:ubiquinone biosynthesis protein COQ9 [Gemmobacter caeni]|uniref:Ubiquinone biosynthesis protein COQ9 n=1 Tax=Gemmobacter caeni TaxID=589035 RepID=A0A2T6B5A6_9RHOB|nr:COQ9 family protein [Gemmobacter caeni]OJY31808.1 MAG: ubiquinone biosynthesis protein [Rhodobacterales bacterium 65-51]PTX51212.1 ubiquinone biosynthesis protein COQ9 [Gemmobacter caeni]TWJ01212.1 ubiquinone biosynthesis protein COQ9 [Gemmobacter caeni]